MSSPLLDPAAAAAAGAPHGQLASRVGGTLRLTSHKLVEDAARATVLLAPGLLRLDVRPVEDTLQVFARSLHEVPPRWELLAGGEDVAAPDEPYRLEWRVRARPIEGTVSLAMTTDWELGVAHFLAQAFLRETVSA